MNKGLRVPLGLDVQIICPRGLNVNAVECGYEFNSSPSVLCIPGMFMCSMIKTGHFICFPFEVSPPGSSVPFHA